MLGQVTSVRLVRVRQIKHGFWSTCPYRCWWQYNLHVFHVYWFRVLLSVTPCTVGHKVTLQPCYCWIDSVSAAHSWSKSCLLALSTCLWVWLLVSPGFAHTSVTCIVTPWQPFISKRRDTLVGIVHRLWTVWSSRSVNLITHLPIRPELRNCGAIPLFSYMPSSQA